MADALVGSVGVEVVPNVQKWNSALRAKLIPAADKLGDELGKHIGDSLRKRLDVAMKNLPNAKVKVNADTGKATAAIDKAARSRSTTINVKVDKGLANTTKLIDKLGSAGSGALSPILALGAVGGPAIAGLGAAAIPVLGGLTAALAPAAAGAGALALVTVPAFTKVKTASQQLAKAQDALSAATTKKQRLTALKQEQQILDKLSPAQRKAVTSYNAFTGAVTKFEDSLQPQAFSVITGGFDLIEHQLPKLSPLAKGAAGAFDGLLKDADKALSDPFWTSFFTFMDTEAPKAITTFGKSFGNIATGVAGITQAFDPEVTSVEGGLDKLTGKFSAFGQKAAHGASPAFNSFQNFISDDAPAAKKLLGDLGGLTGKVIKDIGPAVKPALQLVDKIATGVGPIVDEIGKDLPGVIKDISGFTTKATPFLQSLGKGFTHTTAVAIHDVATGLDDLITDVDKIHPGAAKTLGEVAGSALAIAGIAKITGVSKLPGLLGKIIGALTPGSKKSLDDLNKTPGTFGKLGKSARGAATDLDKFSKAKSHEKDALSGNDKLLDANAKGFENMGDEAVRAGGKVGNFTKFAGAGLGVAGLGGAIDITAKDDTAAGVKSAKQSVKIHADPIKLQAENFVQPGVKAAQNDVATGLHSRTIDLRANNLVAPSVRAAQKDVDTGLHGKTVTLSANGLSGIRSVEQRAQGFINGLTGRNALLTASGVSGVHAVVNAAEGFIRSFTGKNAILSASGASAVRSVVSAAQSYVNSFRGKSVTISTTHVDTFVEHHKTGGKTGNSGIGGGSLANQLHLPGAKGLSKLEGKLPGFLKDPLTQDLFELVGATGGKMHGPGTGTSDSVPAALSKDEWVIKAARARQLGDAFMNWVNYGSGTTPPGSHRFAGGGTSATQTPRLLRPVTVPDLAPAQIVPVVNVYLDSKPVAARVEHRQLRNKRLETRV